MDLKRAFAISTVQPTQKFTMVAVSCFQKDSLHFWVKRREQNKFQIGQNEKMWGREERERESKTEKER